MQTRTWYSRENKEFFFLFQGNDNPPLNRNRKQAFNKFYFIFCRINSGNKPGTPKPRKAPSRFSLRRLFYGNPLLAQPFLQAASGFGSSQPGPSGFQSGSVSNQRKRYKGSASSGKRKENTVSIQYTKNIRNMDFLASNITSLNFLVMCKGRRDYRMTSFTTISRPSWRDSNVTNGR